MQHFYYEIQGWSELLIPLYRRIVPQLPDDCKVVEVGCWRGRSTAFLAVELLNHKTKFSLGCVDTWLGSPLEKTFEHPMFADVLGDPVFEEFNNNMDPVKEHISVMRMTSVEAAKRYADNSLDFIAIDDDHSYKGIKRSLDAWLPKLKPGGFIAGDDVGPNWPNVEKAVTRMFGDEWVRLDAWECPDSYKESKSVNNASWYWQKPTNV